MSKFEHFCWIWNFKNTLFEQVCDKAKDSLCVRFEDLMIKSEKINNLLEFIKPNSNVIVEKESLQNKNKVNYNIVNRYPSWHSWSKDKTQTLNTYCGKLMQKYGYGKEKEWNDKLK